ncbi:response regulator [Thermodesulfobacteriota bacterium]
MVDGKKGKILVVDDEPDVREMLARMLAVEGYDCETAPSGEAAIGYLQTGRCDLIIIDIMMPGMSGMDLLTFLTTMLSHIPVIVITAVENEDTARSMLELGAHSYVVKPFDRRKIVKHVSDALDTRPSGKSPTGEAHYLDPEMDPDYKARQATQPALKHAGLLEEDDESPQLIDGGLYATETIDLDSLLPELDRLAAKPEPTGVRESSFGKLMEALPIPSLLIDSSRQIVFVNQACEKISPEYDRIQGGPFSSLFPDPKAASQAQSLVEKVFATRKTQIIEGVLKIDKKRIWGRAHLRSLRLGRDGLILTLIEDLTLEKTQLRLQKKLRKELQKRVNERTEELKAINERLQEEIKDRTRAEEELRKHQNQLEDLVAERNTELNTTIKRLKKEIKDRKQVEKSLRASESRFNIAFRSNPGAVSIATLKEGRFVDVNDNFCRSLGYSQDEIIGHTAEELNIWAMLGQYERMMRTLLAEGAIRDLEAVFRKKDGRMIVASVSSEVIDLDRQPHVLSVSMDITERKKSERDRSRMTTAIEQAAESMLITDQRGVIKYVNPAFEAISGYARAEIHGKKMSHIRSPENERGVMSQIKTRLDAGEVWKGRLINRKKSGTRYQVETTISPVKGDSGSTINFVVVERDVTKEGKLEEQLRQSQKMQAIGTLAGGIAHDFNNILMAVMGYIHLAKEQLPESNRLGRDLDQALKAGNRARDLISQILTFSRQAEQERRSLEVGVVFKEALKLLRASIPSTIEIRQSIPANAGSVLADPTQMHQLMMNLCTNAYHAMEGKHGVLTVNLTAEQLDADTVALKFPDTEPGHYMKLSISDTGCGMTTEVLERIFEPYFTTKVPGKGTGMGLAVVHGIVSSHGGQLTVFSEVGVGTTFNVYLPRSDSDAETEQMRESHPPKNSAHILLVDDEEPIVDIEKRVLTALGYTVTGMTDSSEALQALTERPGDFDILIADLMMPKITGLELAEKTAMIRPDLPVILCTGFGEPLAREKVRELGIQDFLMKPIAPSDLGEAVAKILRNNSEE